MCGLFDWVWELLACWKNGAAEGTGTEPEPENGTGADVAGKLKVVGVNKLPEFSTLIPFLPSFPVFVVGVVLVVLKIGMVVVVPVTVVLNGMEEIDTTFLLSNVADNDDDEKEAEDVG